MFRKKKTFGNETFTGFKKINENFTSFSKILVLIPLVNKTKINKTKYSQWKPFKENLKVLYVLLIKSIKRKKKKGIISMESEDVFKMIKLNIYV